MTPAVYLDSNFIGGNDGYSHAGSKEAVEILILLCDETARAGTHFLL